MQNLSYRLLGRHYLFSKITYYFFNDILHKVENYSIFRLYWNKVFRDQRSKFRDLTQNTTEK